MLLTDIEDRGVVAEDTAVVAGKLELAPFRAVFGLKDEDGSRSGGGTPREEATVTLASLNTLVFV